ncbi:MAG: glycosyltransferase [Syntrophaceae bacterium]|nr:glycosyltransferase [Syntrophaceae bacterium]
MNPIEPVEISVVVPVFNEEWNLPILISKLVQVLNPIGLPYEMIFVDDGSTDGSRRILREMAIQYPSLRIIEVLVLHHSRKFGKSKYNIRNRALRSFIDLLGVRWMKGRRIQYDVEERI